MTPETWTSILLVAIGAAITLTSTLIVESIRARRQRKLRDEDRRLSRRASGIAYAQRVLDVLDDLWADMNDWKRLNGKKHGYEVKTEYSRLIYRTFLLIPDSEIRQLVQNGIYALNNYESLYPLPGRNKVMVDEQLEILLAMRVNLARWIRGDHPVRHDVERLQERADFVDARLAEEE
jgi:hypothetical protein